MLLALSKTKRLTTRTLSFGEEYHGGRRVARLRYCGGSWMLSSWTSKIRGELGGMVPSGVPFSP